MLRLNSRYPPSVVFDAPQREDEGIGRGEVDDFPKQRLVIKCSLWQALHFGGRGLKMAREKIEEGKWGIEDSPCSPISSLPTPTPLPFSLPNAEALILTFVLTTFQVG